MFIQCKTYHKINKLPQKLVWTNYKLLASQHQIYLSQLNLRKGHIHKPKPIWSLW